MAKSAVKRRREADARKREQGLTMCKVWIRPEHKGKLKVQAEDVLIGLFGVIGLFSIAVAIAAHSFAF